MSKKVVLITGGSSGIGFEMAKQMDDIGYKVIICGRSESKLAACKKKRKSLVTIRCDIANSDDRHTLYKKIESEFGSLDMLVNNAGRGNRYLFNEESEESFETKLEDDYQINQKAPLMMAKLFVPMLSQSKGTLINVTTGLIHTPLFIEPSYCGNKSALHFMTMCIRHQLEELGIKTIEVMYPEVDTPFQHGNASDRAMKPDEAARIAIVGILAGKDEVHVGMAGFLKTMTRLMPKRIFKMMTGFVPKDVKTILYAE